MTWNLDERLEQHSSGKGSNFTAKHGFKELKWFKEFTDIVGARECERQVKDFSRKKRGIMEKYQRLVLSKTFNNNHNILRV